MAILYYNAAVNTNWSTLGNWWTNEECSVAASSLPSSSDDVVIMATCISNSGSIPTVNSFTTNVSESYWNDNSNSGFVPFCISLNVTNTATINQYSIYGNNNYSTPVQTVPIILNCAEMIINNGGWASGTLGIAGITINGDVTINGSSYTYATINGDVVLNDGYCESVVNGSVTVNSTNTGPTYYFPFVSAPGINAGPSGLVTFNGDYIISTGGIVGDVVFNGGVTGPQINGGTITGNVIFASGVGGNGGGYSLSVYSGTINGNVTFYGNTLNEYNGFISGVCSFNDYSNNYGDIVGDCTINDNTYFGPYGNIGISGNCTFNDNSIFFAASSPITGDVIFNDDSAIIEETIIGDVIFNDNSVAIKPTINGDVTWNGHVGYKDNIAGYLAGTFSGGRRTVYYNNASTDGDWSNSANWWADSGYTVGASYIPNELEDADIGGDVSVISAGNAVVNYVVGGHSISPRPTMNINLTTNTASFNFNIGNSGILNVLSDGGVYPVGTIGESTIDGTINFPSGIFQMQGSTNNGTINANCRLIASSNNGTIIGNCIFNPPDDSYSDSPSVNAGSISGVCVFYDASNSYGTITGNCTFYDSSYNEYPGTITGNVTFNDNSGNGNWDTYSNNTGGGDIVGDVIFNNSSTHIAVVGSLTKQAKITGNVTYNDYSYRAYCTTHSNNVVFNDYSTCEGSYFYDINGNSNDPNSNVFVVFNDYSYTFSSDIFLGVIMNDYSYIGYWSVGSEVSVTLNDYTRVDGASAGFDIPWIFNDNSYITSSTNIYAYNDPPGNTLTFNHNSYNDGSIEANTVTFNDSSYNNGPITCTTSTFKDSSYNSASGIITGDEVYNDRTPYPIPRGINGSSILGII